MKAKKVKKSVPALIMDVVIGVALLLAAVCFACYYGGWLKNVVILWAGIVSFTVFYQLWLRILFGKITARVSPRYSHPWFREHAFEKRLYRLLQVRKWKEKVLTYDPEAFSVKKHTLEEIAMAMTKAETDHWFNVLLSLLMLLFAIPWGGFWVFLIAAIVGVLFDAQFIAVQRYNRPRVLRLLVKRRAKGMEERI